MKKILFLFLIFISEKTYSQHVSIHEESLNFYNSTGLEGTDYEQINAARPMQRTQRAACDLNKIVYGWHPYWSNGLQLNYDWSLLSHFCYFSYEVDAASGNAISTHSFSTAQAVTDALNNNVKVNLCVTLFSNHATLLNNATAKQTLINNLISLIQSRGAHGVNIDFEGLPLSQKTNFTNFMNSLATQMHAAIPGSEVSTVLYAVDWNNVIDVVNMPNVDLFIIMGYDYYWTGSTTAGPNDPLFHFSNTYNYTLSRSVTEYLDKGIPASKLILGLPYYGREWPVASTGVPATTTGSGSSRTFQFVKDNSSGNYSSLNKFYESASFSTYYQFNNGGVRQCFISEKDDLSERLDFINKRGIGGMGIWALGYDDGYNDFWDEIYEHFTTCTVSPCADNLFDIGGGPVKNYYDNEDYTFTIAPAGASSITTTFSSFSLENNYDFLYIYDGVGTSAAQIAGSPFTGNNSPGTFTSSTGALTFRFVSDGSTTAAGWNATYACLADSTPPLTAINVNGNWQTQHFTATFTDTDNTNGSGINEKFYQVLDYNGSEWRANATHGFFNDNFTTSIHPEWTNQTGVWAINTGRVNQTSETEQNSNLHAQVAQNSTDQYLYHWQMNMGGTGTNRRAGMHFFCDDPTLPNRGNSYFVYYRVDSDKCQIYKVVNDVFTLMTDDDITVNPNTWYDCKVSYDPATGNIKAYLNDALVSEWTDPVPYTSGNAVSLRSGGTNVLYDDVKVYRSRNNSALVTIGTSAHQVRYQNSGLLNPGCRIKSLVNDNSGNWSVPVGLDVNIDWSNPASPVNVYDGLSTDADTSYDNTTIKASYVAGVDPHSEIDEYWYSIGIAAGDSSVLGWTNNSSNLSFVHNGLNLNYGTAYFVNIRTKNGAGLTGNLTSSDGILMVQPASPPIAGFYSVTNDVCETDSLQFINTTIYGNSWSWSVPGANPSTSNLSDPYFSFSSSGVYTVTLIAGGPGGADTSLQTITLNLHLAPQASFFSNDTVFYLPDGFAAFTNSSQNTTLYSWDFGDGNLSTDIHPWNDYLNAGTFIVTLLAGNDYCAADTAMQTIYVYGSSGLNDVDANENFMVYPIPTTNEINIISNKFLNEDIILHLFDETGRLVYHSLFENFNGQVKISDTRLASGIYLLRFGNDQLFEEMKISVVK